MGPGEETYANVGQVDLQMVNEDGLPCTGEFQVADGLKKPLAAVCDSCDKGNICLFDNDGSFMIRRDSPEGRMIRELAAKAKRKTRIYRKNGVYVMPVWIQPPEESISARPFHGQGRR